MPFKDQQGRTVRDWSIEHARQLYNIENWGGGYFDINKQGRVIARSSRLPEHPGVDLFALAVELKLAGLTWPVLVRFQHILHDRLHQIQEAFASAMHRYRYPATYTAVYPIKVNQQRSVVQTLVADNNSGVGLEAGSKPELIAVLGVSHETGVVICNGYKDREYVRLALIGHQMGYQIYIVIEKPSELDLVMQEAYSMNVTPSLGVRVRLTSIANGKWQNTGGEKAKFGLSTAQTLALIENLRSHGRLNCLRLLHFHMGSQIPDIEDIHRGMLEAARCYTELHSLGVNITTVDVGGGLGIDYEGTKSRAYCSINYTLREYADAVTRAFSTTCEDQRLPCPNIIAEAGRAITAHHAVLITNVIEVESMWVDDRAYDHKVRQTAIHHALEQLLVEADLGDEAIYSRAERTLSRAQTLYLEGHLSLSQKALAEALFRDVVVKLSGLLSNEASPQTVRQLEDKLADKYFCNFSVFQSVPDVWAFNQIFPIMPLHRLDEIPSRRATLQDLTCDSDGQIQSYINGRGLSSTLALHKIRPSEPYLIGFFLLGAYQEILGDRHNLFGDTHSVNVELAPNGQHRLTNSEFGDSVEELLRYVHFDPDVLLEVYRERLYNARVDPRKRQAYIQELAAGLANYTYLG